MHSSLSRDKKHHHPVLVCTVWVKKIPPLRTCGNFSKTLQLWRSYAILSVTTQFTSCAQDVHYRQKRIFWHFSQTVRNFCLNFTCPLNIHTYAKVQIFVQLSPTVTKLCHIMRDHHNVQCSKCPSSTTRHTGWSHLISHNFVTVGDNWTKIRSLA